MICRLLPVCVYAVAGYAKFLVKLYRVGCFLCCLERKLLCHSTWVLIIGVLTIPRISAARKNSHLSAALKMPFSAVDVLVNQTERVRRAGLPYAMVKGIQCHFSFSSPSGLGDFYKSFICSPQNYQVPAAPAAARTGRRQYPLIWFVARWSKKVGRAKCATAGLARDAA